jgi:hypothetical protein
MSRIWIRKTLAVAALAASGLVVGCFDTDVTGKYRDTDGNKLELKDGGNVGMDIGQLHIEGKYTVDGDKVTIRPEGGPSPSTLVLTVDKDGSLTPQPNPIFTKFSKAR